ncbi:MAG: hypothetical protein K8U57_07560, partial [Planctomycetes bacterium]|nr:hypothetical protein [Planctomycetota bacterium]
KIEGVAHVVDDAEWAKVESGVYTGFSHGGSYKARWADPERPGITRYTPELAEVSLVDNPCVPTATFEFIKEDGTAELRKFNSGAQEAQELMTDSQTQEDIKKDAPVEAVEKGESQEALAKEAAERPQDKGGVQQVWQAKDGSTHLSKADALMHNAGVEAQSVADAAAAPVQAALEKIDAALSKKEAVTKDDEMEMAAGEPEKKDEAAEDMKEGEAGTAGKAADTEDLKKGMYAVSTFAELLQSIQYLQQDTQWEAEWENDGSELPAKLKAWLAEGGALLTAMAAEETAELTAEKAAGGDLAKAGARNNKADADRIQKMHDTSTELGASCAKDDSAEKAAPAADLTKVTAERDALSKAIGDLTPKMEALLKRVEQLEAQPMPAKGIVRAVDKATDAGGETGGDVMTKFNEHLAGLTPDQRNSELMKLALRNPVVVKA